MIAASPPPHVRETVTIPPLIRSPSEGLAAKMAAGGLSCMCINTLFNPMDVVKIRLQTQNQLLLVSHSHAPIEPLLSTARTAILAPAAASTHSASPLHRTNSMYAEGKYKGMTHGLLTIYREEGYARGLMRGSVSQPARRCIHAIGAWLIFIHISRCVVFSVTPSLMREASYSSIRMGLYDYFRALLAPAGTAKSDFTLFHKVTAGACSGALASSLCSPFDLMKIRFQSYSLTNPNPYRHALHAYYELFRTSGLAGLYKGVGPTTARGAVLNSACLASYDHSKAWLIRTGRGSDGLGSHLFASLVSGVVTVTVVNPFDVIKTRIMTDGSNAVEGGGRRRYKSSLDCVWQTWRAEGGRAFSKGWTPNYCRLGPHFVLSLPLGEWIRRQLGADTY